MNDATFEFASRDFLVGVTRLCRERGTLFIIDESRTGIARTGKQWASELYVLRPDILDVGKGLSGGLYPVSALLGGKDRITESMMTWSSDTCASG